MSKMKRKDLPKKVAPYFDHGCDLRKQSQGDWIGSCPFCDKDNHFFVAEKTGMFDCKVCGEEGNTVSFLTLVSSIRAKETTTRQLKELEKLRGIPVKILRRNKVSKFENEWHIPINSVTGTVRDIRRWTGKMMMATNGCETQLHGIDKLKKAAPNTVVWICEGEWDKMAMEWMCDAAGVNDVCVGLPGSTTFKKDWIPLFQGKRVYGLHDHDDAGDKGVAKAYKLLKGKCRELKFVHWPEQREKGYDCRDYVISAMSNRGAKVGMRRMKRLLHGGLRNGRVGSSAQKQEASDWAEEKQYTFTPYADIVKAYKDNGVMMNDDMAEVLLVILAVCISTNLGSDPLWLNVVAPAASGKTLLLAGLLKSDTCIFRSTLTPHCLVSGWKGGEDPSLIPHLSGKTFILKDFTEILSMPLPAQDEIFSTLRGAYDGSVVKTFGNGEHREYGRHTDPQFLGFNMVAGVTNAIHARDDVSMGERFLKINMRTQSRAHSTAIHMAAINAIGKEAKQEEAIQEAVTGFLTRRLDGDNLPPLPKHMAMQLDALVRLIATLRAHVPRDMRTQDIQYRPIPEAGTRLMKQLGKLAMAISFSLEEKQVSDKAFDIVRRVAFDTAYGFHLDVIEAMMDLGGAATKADVAKKAALPSSTVSRRFDDLILLRAVEKTEEKTSGATGRPAVLYRVSKEISELWEAQQTATKTKPTQQSNGQKERSVAKSGTLPISLGRRSRLSTRKSARPNRSYSKKRTRTKTMKGL